MKTIEKKVIIHFILSLFLLILPSLINAQTAVAPSGSGTGADPYLIANLNNLYWITQNPPSWNSYFKQTADIDASSTSSWDGGAGFTPIGNNPNSFSGSYDGDNHTISNLYINRSLDEYGGLFGYAITSDIKNIGLINVNINASGIVGALVGRTYFANVTNCYSTGSVAGDSHYVGGLIGDNVSTHINTSYSTCTVSGKGMFVGGLVGANNSSNIYNSYATGSVQGEIRVGGLAGANYTGTINNSYSTGSVTGTGSVGGLLGVISGSTTKNSFWDKQTSGQSSSADGTGKTTAEMKTAITFLGVGWDNNRWNMGDGINNGYPYLDFQNTSGTTLVASAAPSGGGSSGNPYLIASLNNLYWVTQNPSSWGSYFKQTADIDASSTSRWDGGAGFTPIGNDVTAFTGSYDGGGYTITDLYINRSSTDFAGMFGLKSFGSDVKNTRLINENITGKNYVGGLTGYNRGTISNCMTSGLINGGSFVGGLAGHNNGTITSSYSNASVSGSGNYSGGLVGENSVTTITNSYSTGSVNGNYGVGGLVGTNNTGPASGTITNCYSTGSVSGNSTLGGLTAEGEPGDITNSFWDTQTSGQSTSVGGTGKTTAEMKTPSTFINAGWDFELEALNGTNDYWDMDVNNASINNGYPFFSWQNGSSIAVTSFDVAIDLGNINVGSTAIEVSNNTSSSSNLYTTSSGKDIIYKFSIVDNFGDAGNIGLTAKTENATFNSVLYLLDESGNQIAVNNGSGNDSEIQDFTKTLTAGTYYIVVDGADASQMGTFDLYLGVGIVMNAAFNLNPQNGCSVPHTVFFTDQSYKPDTWKWTFGDGGTSTAQNPIHSYTSTGNFIVTLTVKDTISLSTNIYEDTVFVSIPNADFSANTTFGCGPLAVDFTDASTDVASWEWDFGDGETSTEQNPSHTYDKPGTYTVTLTGTSSNGCQDTKTATNYIQVIGPDINFGIASTISGGDSFTVKFVDSTTPTSPIVSWDWDFGDGGNSTSQNPTHVYTTAGIYNVSLTVSDLDGCTRVLTKTNLVNTGPSVTINQAAGQADPTNSSTINFTAVFSQPVVGFSSDDVTIGGTAGATTATVTETVPNDSTTYNVAISGMANDGTIIVSITAGVAKDTVGVNNWNGTSSDNTVTYDTQSPFVSIDPPNLTTTNGDPVSYSVIYTNATSVNLTPDDIILNTTGSANGTPIITNGTTSNPIVTINNIKGAGTLGFTIKPGTSSDAVGNTDAGSEPSKTFTVNLQLISPQINDTTMYEDDSLKITLEEFDDIGNKINYTVSSSMQSINSYFVGNILFLIPAPNWNGNSRIDIIQTNSMQSATWNFNLDILPVNDAPVINLNGIDTLVFNEDEDTVFSINSLYKFVSDPDNQLSELKVSLESNSSNITINTLTDTSVVICAKENWNGIDSITVNVSDTSLTTSAAIIIHVLPVNDIPVFSNVPDTVKIDSETEITLQVFDLVSDVETPDTGLTISFNISTDSIQYNYFKQTGELKLSPVTGYSGNASLNIKAVDADSASNQTSLIIKVERTITDIEQTNEMPKQYSLAQNYPNPFNPSTNIKFTIPKRSFVSLKVYDILGKEVAQLVNKELNPGSYTVQFDASDANYGLASGIYFYSLESKQFHQTKKFILVK